MKRQTNHKQENDIQIPLFFLDILADFKIVH